jgi:hypothetical protein
MRSALRFALLLGSLAAPPLALAADETLAPSFCGEWIRQSRDGYERVTLFSDQALVWKVRRSGEPEDIRRKKIGPDETKYYCDFFARPEFERMPADLRTRLNAEFVSESVITVARPNGSQSQIHFDDLSTLSPDISGLRAALEGLRTLFTRTIAPASRFTTETLKAGMVLTRFDGVQFRIRMVDSTKGVVELEGISQPFSTFRRIDELRFLFRPPGE